MMRSFAAVLVSCLALGCGSSERRSQESWVRASIDTQELPRESAVVLPAFPQESDLLEFPFGPTGSHRYFIDTRSLSVGADGVVRYAIVIKTAGGAVNTSFEGIRCATRQKRLYAVGRGANKWVEAKRPEWRDIGIGNASEYQAALFNEAFCPGKIIARDRDQALSALRASAHGGPSVQ